MRNAFSWDGIRWRSPLHAKDTFDWFIFNLVINSVLSMSLLIDFLWRATSTACCGTSSQDVHNLYTQSFKLNISGIFHYLGSSLLLYSLSPFSKSTINFRLQTLYCYDESLTALLLVTTVDRSNNTHHVTTMFWFIGLTSTMKIIWGKLLKYCKENLYEIENCRTLN